MRTWMIDFRKKLGLDLRTMATVCQCSPGLLVLIERDDWVTHPKIAARIADAYRMDLTQYNAIVPKVRRADQIPAPEPPPNEKDWRKFTYFFERSGHI